MSSRADILHNLSQKKPTFTSSGTDAGYLHVVPNIPDDPQEMLARFIREAEKLSCVIHQADDQKDAVDKILALVDGGKTISGWSFEEIGLPGLEEAFTERDIHLDELDNPETRFGITGLEAALSATGSIILASGDGKSRSASLLPPIHIAVLRSDQIIRDLESWASSIEKENLFQEVSNIFLISGPSKTADIAMELIMGMHGPQELHIIILKS
jgi:L-lactate dehydrogenase complex protein LldG